MSNQICACNVGINNLALPDCVDVQKVIKKIIFVNLNSNAGTANKIDPSNSNIQSWMTALLNNTDLSLRFFPTPELKNITTDKDDPEYEKFEDGSSIYIREGIRTFKAILPNCPPMLKKKFESIRCNQVGAYLIDIEGNVIGRTQNGDAYLYPLPVNAQSMNAKSMWATDKTATNLAISFEFPTSLYDGDIRMISSANFSDFNMLAISGLLDVTATVSAKTTTGFTLTLVTPSSTLDVPVAVQGLVASNFVGYVSGTTSKIYDSTTSADKTVTVTEGNPGVYAVAFSAASSADVLKIKISKNGYDWSGVNPTNNPIVIP